MTSNNAVNEILDFAIRGEEEARDFYNDLASKLKNPSMKVIFEEFAAEEDNHRAKLLEVRASGEFSFHAEQVQDLKIADYLVVEPPKGELDYQQALVIAMKKEKKAFQMYTKLSESAKDEAIRDLFAFLAQEEAKHKLRIELEYDDVVLSEN